MAFHTPKELKTNDSKHHPSPLEVQPTKHFVAGQLRKNLGMIHGSRIPDPTKWAKFGRLGLPGVRFRRHGLIAIASPCRRRPGQQLEPFYMARFALEVVQVSWDFFKGWSRSFTIFQHKGLSSSKKEPNKMVGSTSNDCWTWLLNPTCHES